MLRSGRVAFFDTFCTWISRQPPLRSWTWLYHKKGNLTQNSMVCRAYGNTAYFSHASMYPYGAIVRYWTKMFSKRRKPCQKQPLPLEARGLPSNTWMPGPTPLTTPNDSSIAARTSTQRRNKVPIGYNGTPQIHPQSAPSPSTINTFLGRFFAWQLA